jgi:hypothetical protein
MTCAQVYWPNGLQLVGAWLKAGQVASDMRLGDSHVTALRDFMRAADEPTGDIAHTACDRVTTGGDRKEK